MTSLVVIGIAVLIMAYLFGPPKKARRLALKRLALFPLYFLFVFFVMFVLSHVAPGDPVDSIAGPAASEEVRERVREELGLNRPLLVQAVSELNEWRKGNFGETYRFPGKSVVEAIGERIPITMAMQIIAVWLSVLLGVAVGLLAVLKRGTVLDTPILMLLLIPAVIPSLVLMQFFILFFSVKMGWLPAGWSGDWQAVFTTKNAILPILVLALSGIAGIARFIRTVTLKIMEEQYVLAAKAKGLSNFKIMTKYVMRNASLPLTTVFLPLFLSVFTGSFFIEMIYGIPGLAAFTLDSVFRRDYPVIMFIGVWGYMFTLFVRLLVDVSLFKLDRRVVQ